MPAMGRHGAFVMPGDDELAFPGVARTAEEALHSVRDTRELALFGLLPLRLKRNFFKQFKLILSVQS
jgi:hypothetical protein